MTGMRAGLALIAGGAIVAGLVALYTGHRDEAGRETERDAPIVAPSRVRAADGGPIVILDSAESRRIGLATAVLASTSGAPPLRLAGQVVEEPERVAAVRAPLPGLLSAPEGGRWPALGERLEAGSMIGRVSDARPLALSMGGTVTRIGARPGEIVAAGQLLLEVVDRSRPTIRVVWDPSGGEPPRRLTVEPPGAARRVQARLIGPAPEADALTRRPVFLYRAERSWPGGTPGTPVSALVPSTVPAARGALVPEAAVVQWDGLTWAYRQRGPGTFERVAVGTDRAVPGGWIATRGLVPGDTIVVTGTQELISEEFRARVGVGDESGE